ncbi:MAG TPA: alpha/beta fold hydrolase [Actinomycetota bacterium]
MSVKVVYETHSISLDNERGIATGWLDGALSERGREAAERLGAIIAPFAWQEGWDYDLSLPLTPARQPLREEILRLDDDGSLWTATSGSGPPLVLCHGGPGLHDYLAPVAAMLDDLLTVHRWDQRGAGRSSRIGPYALDRFVADLEAIRAHLGHARWIVGGHSWGATPALHYALAHPERTSALIYMSGTGLAWSKWKRAHHDEEESRLDPEDRERFVQLKDKMRRGLLTESEEHEFQILNDLPNFADRSRARALVEADVEQMLRYSINYQANRELSAEMEALDERRLKARCGGLHVPMYVVHGEGDPRPAAATDSLVDAFRHRARLWQDRRGLRRQHMSRQRPRR